MREIKNEAKHYLETKIHGAYETTDINWQSDFDGNHHRVFDDTEVDTTPEHLITERKMMVDGKAFTVCSIFPSVPTSTPTNKMLNVIENDLEK